VPSQLLHTVFPVPRIDPICHSHHCCPLLIDQATVDAIDLTSLGAVFTKLSSVFSLRCQSRTGICPPAP
jgi:hypothetical protein